MKKPIIILGIIALIAGSCGVQTTNKQISNIDNNNNNMNRYQNKFEMVWGEMNVRYRNEQGFPAEKGRLAVSYDIKELPPEIKTIIAFYTQFIPAYVRGEGTEDLANALGNFSTLEEAQTVLLKDKEAIFERISEKLKNTDRIPNLYLKISGNRVSFEYGRTDDFIIENGNIKLISQ